MVGFEAERDAVARGGIFSAVVARCSEAWAHVGQRVFHSTGRSAGSDPPLEAADPDSNLPNIDGRECHVLR